MPNTKSAEKRVRSNARKAAHNKTIKSRLKSLEKKYLSLVTDGKLDDAKVAYRDVASAFDKAAKVGVIKREKASRKRSRLQLNLNRASAKPVAK